MKLAAHIFRLLLLLLALGLAAIVLHNYLTPKLPPPPLTGTVDLIVVEKAARRLTVYRSGDPLRSYVISLGFEPVGDKRQQGDGRTPEGVFKIDRRNASSAFHLSLGINYPRPEDRARAASAGVNPGGDIFNHGQPNALADLGTIRSDWTAGCIAVTDDEIEELFRVAPLGTPVEIRP